MNLSARLAWTQTLSLWRSGALRVLIFSLVLAVTAISAIGFFTQRVETALNQQGGLLLGGDIAVIADHAIPDALLDNAEKQGIATAKTYEFSSMVVFGEGSQLAEIKAVEQAFPLRGDLTLGKDVADVGLVVKTSPKQGEVWIEPRLANLLNIKVGDDVEVGERKLHVSAILVREPSRGGDMFGFAPRLMMNAADLPSTKLIQYGSRVKYQLLLAASPEKINQYNAQNKSSLSRGEKIQDVRNARPEIKSALDKAQQFLGLSAMVSVILAMVAMLLSSLPYIKQSLDTFALMRCFGASKSTVLQVLAIQTILIAFFSALLGVLLGFIAQFGLATLAGSLFLESLPPASSTPVLIGLAASIAMMFAVVLPHAWQMRNLTAMNILRRETLAQPISAQAKFLPAALVMCAMIFWQARDGKLAASTIVALVLLCVAIVGLSYVLVTLANRLFMLSPKSQVLNDMKLGVLGLKRRFGLSTVQMIGFSMGLMVLMLLALIRGDLIRNWQASLPIDAPNRFIINIQPSQIDGVKQFFQKQEITGGSIFPMVRGRLISKNGKEINATQWQDERAKRLAEREFNLSWAAQMQSDNQLLSGRWWTPKEYGKPYLSIEQDLAKTLGIQLGDKLIFDVAGDPLTLTVTSLRKVDWDTMRANFFAVTPPGVLDNYSANYISSFHLPIGTDAAMNQLIRSYPNLTVIDVAALMQQVRGIMQKMSSTIEYVFAFSLLAGLAVLYAALIATREERIAEATLMRVFGASRRQVSIAYIAEFACIGLVSALIATVAANLLAYYISAQILNIPFQFNATLALGITLIAAIVIPLAAWLGLRGYLNVPARQLLNSI
ncbi:FtsX-like permease family protein [Methylotenera sp.]|uniref:ABC transporter permease n=1 Tax=Methylotenera sp. TaxID=2051956 RepID=UPI0024883EDC|nr:FtsX-like permease family protein [Methylotenera sp.]MDI1298170.1 FtsX-like permease family protein [Methylotenera sp.]